MLLAAADRRAQLAAHVNRRAVAVPHHARTFLLRPQRSRRRGWPRPHSLSRRRRARPRRPPASRACPARGRLTPNRPYIDFGEVEEVLQKAQSLIDGYDAELARELPAGDTSIGAPAPPWP